jgi:hypothetical protein
MLVAFFPTARIAGGTAMKHPSRGRKSFSAFKISLETSRVSDLRRCVPPAPEWKAGETYDRRSWTLTLSFFASGGLAGWRLISCIFRYITGFFSPDRNLRFASAGCLDLDVTPGVFACTEGVSKLLSYGERNEAPLPRQKCHSGGDTRASVRATALLPASLRPAF